MPGLSLDRARETAQRYLDLWSKNDYAAMYGASSSLAKAAITQERFTGRYQSITAGIAITQVVGQAADARLFPSATNPATATVSINVTMQSARVGQIAERNTMSLVAENGSWRVAWTPELIFRDLSGANVVRIDPEDPARGSIIDRKGRMLAGPGAMASVGLVPGNLKDEAMALQALSGLLGLAPEAIKAKYAGAKPDWWIPVRDLPESKRAEAQSKLNGIAGVEVRKKDARVYPQGEMAAHVIGYVSPVTADDLAKAGFEGYEEGDWAGRAGIEGWAERQLAGEKGGRLLIADPEGNTVRVIAQRKARAGQTVQLTIDLDLQLAAEKVLGDKTGSITAIDPRDNSILAMVSHPTFDPNGFVAGMSDDTWQRLWNDPRKPFQSRPNLSAYPTGSIFKVVTMAAGLERGGFKPDSQFVSTGTWTGLPGVVLREWVPEGHGKVDLRQGLVVSSNVVFYEVSKALDTIDNRILPEFARGFGLGSTTGLLGLPESAGTVPDPAWKERTQGQGWYPGDTVNLGIGQGFLEATPLQMTNLYAALANGGELRTPVVVRGVGEGGDPQQYASQVKGRLPASPATLAVIRSAMKDVASTSRGTAYYAFNGFPIPTAAKTGSAENQNADAHAWFAGYAPADAPEVVVVVMVEGGRAGGEVAAPLGRQVMAAYFKR